MPTADRTSNPHLRGGSATRKTRATGDDNDDGNWYCYLLVFVVFMLFVIDMDAIRKSPLPSMELVHQM